MSDREACKICGNLLVTPTGHPDATLFMLGEFPGQDDVISGRAWTVDKDRVTPGEVLREELKRIGISPNYCRFGNIWQHGVNKKCDFEWHKEQAWNQLHGAKAVLLMGSLCADVYLDSKISDVSGLVVKSKLMPESVEVVMAMLNPAIVLQRESVGEIRLAMDRFAEVSRPWRK